MAWHGAVCDLLGVEGMCGLGEREGAVPGRATCSHRNPGSQVCCGRPGSNSAAQHRVTICLHISTASRTGGGVCRAIRQVAQLLSSDMMHYHAAVAVWRARADGCRARLQAGKQEVGRRRQGATNTGVLVPAVAEMVWISWRRRLARDGSWSEEDRVCMCVSVCAQVIPPAPCWVSHSGSQVPSCTAETSSRGFADPSQWQ